MIDTVLCFDRDKTVNVNPPEEKTCVPLKTVKWYAHEADHIDVYATGNQHLRKEAEIPGLKEARDIWTKQRERSVEPFYPSISPFTYKPSRRNGLRLIKDCYDYADVDVVRFVVVDDADISNMRNEDWNVYKPWDFVTTTLEPELAVPSDNPYTDTSIESKACHEDVIRHCIFREWH